MRLAKDIQVYVKTTETCNLNCSHCFTSGSKGAKIFFHPEKTADFLIRLHQEHQLNSAHLILHGGEPMLAPLRDLERFCQLTKAGIGNVGYGIQTNLIYELDTDRRKFFKEIFTDYGMGTSWDPNIRFGSTRLSRANAQLLLWESNVQKLLEDGHLLTLMVGISSYVVKNYEPKDIIDYAIGLGFQHILFERLTVDGNAIENPHIFPPNASVDAWIYKMWQQTRENDYHKKIGNMFLEELASSLVHNVHVANRCRGCEEKIITINADGSLAGCPNSAPHAKWGHIEQSTSTFLNSGGRTAAICAEKIRRAPCFTCEVNDLCNGDCYKLKWEGDICAAPKTLMKSFKANPQEYDFAQQILL